MRGRPTIAPLIILAVAARALAAGPEIPLEQRKNYYIREVTRGDGVGLMPWQDAGPSSEETAFRDRMERRKTELLAGRTPVAHPVLIDGEARARALENSRTDWGRRLVEGWRERADYILAQPEQYVQSMIAEQTPGHDYGFTCPNCVGRLTQEGAARSLIWDFREPDRIGCSACGQTYPDERFPETAVLAAPRSGQSFSFYLNTREQENPSDRTGRLAYQWIGQHPMQMSFSGMIRQKKNAFLVGSLNDLAFTYLLTGESRYAAKAIEILERFAHCYRNWLYFDYFGTIADCDPLYAAWNDEALPLEWKRSMHGLRFAEDSLERAAMVRNFWGAGRYAPSTDSMGTVYEVALAYDLVCDAVDANGAPLWTEAGRRRVERDLFLEWIFTGEPYLGGAGRADTTNNKAPRIYHAMASVGRVLGLPDFCEVALKGYEALRDRSFTYDGFSHESAGYTMMFLRETLPIVERLQGYSWPERLAHRRALTDPYRGDAKLRQMFRAPLDLLSPGLTFLPLEDTGHSGRPTGTVVEIGLKGYPEYYSGKGPLLMPEENPSEWALFNLAPDELNKASAWRLPEIYYPAWMTALMRHGQGPEATVAALNFSPPGNHRQRDSLTLYYLDSGREILGDIGYVGDTPHLRWLGSSMSHNLVIVDGEEQRFRGEGSGRSSAGPVAALPESQRKGARRPKLEMMLTTPRLSAVEASSEVYDQCSEYRRTVVMIKGPQAQTFLVDLFRVAGGLRHDYRVWSELASNRSSAGEREFVGLDLPVEGALPDFGASLEREHIFGLMDENSVNNPPARWQAIWREQGRAYRLWNLTDAHRVTASHGSGQESHANPGRRVRFLDITREGEDLRSVFVSVHEPSAPDGSWAIRSVRRLDLPPEAGEQAVALEIDSGWGRYLVLSEFARETEVEGVRFSGKLGVWAESALEDWLVAGGVQTFWRDGFGFQAAPAYWAGTAERMEGTRIAVSAETPRPAGFAALPPSSQNWVLLHDGEYETGFPLAGYGQAEIRLTNRFPLPLTAHKAFRVPALQVMRRPAD